MTEDARALGGLIVLMLAAWGLVGVVGVIVRVLL